MTKPRCLTAALIGALVASTALPAMAQNQGTMPDQPNTAPSMPSQITPNPSSTISGAARATPLNPSMLRVVDGKDKTTTYNGMTASQLEGTNIVNAKGDKIGDVKKVLAGNDSQVVGVTAEVGGIMGFGGTEVIVPMTDLSYDPQKKNFTTTMTADQLKAMPKAQRTPNGQLR